MCDSHPNNLSTGPECDSWRAMQRRKGQFSKAAADDGAVENDAAEYAAAENSATGNTTSGRRSMLKSSFAGAMGIGSVSKLFGSGFALTQIAEQLARASDSPREDADGKRSKHARSLIVLWLQGGPSQLETFDPHPGTKIGGDIKAISTSVSGLSIADTMPLTAEQMHLATVVRSIVSKEGDHERATYHLKTGWRPDPTLVHPSIGAVLCHETQDPNLEIPRHITILSGQWPAKGGYLGADLNAFQCNDPSQRLPNLEGLVTEAPLEKRLRSLSGLVETQFAKNRFTNLDRDKTQHETATRRAMLLMDSDQIEAFDIQKESQSTRDQFGDTSFGRGCLAAIRLIEKGVRCVEVELSGWDTHINNHDLQSSNCKILDAALAGLMKELERRDLLDSTVVMCGGEFGRTPQINVAGGRDHWPTGFSTLLAGGPFRRGYAHGNTSKAPSEDSEKRWNEIDNKVTVQDLHASVLSSLGIDLAKEIQTPIGRPMVLGQGAPVRELLDI